MLAWIIGPELGIEEGVHAYWHLRARNAAEWKLRFLDETGTELPRREVQATTELPRLAISSARQQPPGGNWRLASEITVPFRLGLRRYELRLWTRAATVSDYAGPSP